METVEIAVARRSDFGKGGVRRLRRRGLVPGILYGPGRASSAITIGSEEFHRKLGRLEGSHLIRLVHDGGEDPELHGRMVLVRETQLHPVSGDVLHADFYEVDLTERLTVSVTLHFIGKPVGVVNGGILQPILREVEVECLPTEIPEFIEVDVSALDIHDAVHLGDLTFPTGATLVGDSTRTVVTVLPPSVEAKPVETAAEAAPTTEGAAAAPVAEAAPATTKKGEG
jgi:large subunit ribosomal protein L25